MIVGIFAPEAVRIVAGPDYAAAIPAVGWSCVYAMFFGLFQILSLPTALDRRLGGVGIANGITAAVSVTGTLLLASHYGASGAMGSIAVGGSDSCLVVTATSRRGSSLRLPLGHLVGGAMGRRGARPISRRWRASPAAHGARPRRGHHARRRRLGACRARSLRPSPR